MITAIFTLTGMALLMTAVSIMDAARFISDEIYEVNRIFGHDPLVFPDHITITP
jgi:hypothetical protein